MKKTTPIVLIDDDRAWLETLADFLEGKGYRVSTAQEGREGLALLQDEDAGLAIIDFHMPGLNGLELLRWLRRSGRELSVLMLSSDDDPALPARALAEGARAFLPKTLTPALLLRSLLQAIVTADRKPTPWERLLPVLLDPRRN